MIAIVTPVEMAAIDAASSIHSPRLTGSTSVVATERRGRTLAPGGKEAVGDLREEVVGDGREHAAAEGAPRQHTCPVGADLCIHTHERAET